MFEPGKKAYFRDEQFVAQIGTIIRKLGEDNAVVILEVRNDATGKLHSVKKVKPDAEHVQAVENFYREYGHY